MFVLYLAVLAAGVYEDGMNLFQFMAVFPDAMNHPFDIRLTRHTVKFMLGSLVIYGGAVAMFYSGSMNRRPGEEHGSAKWGDVRFIDRKYRSRDMFSNKLLTQNVGIGLDGRKHRRNLNTMVVGGSGAGKTRFYAKPNLCQCNTSFVVLDPKGELVRDTGYLLEQKGYQVRVLDLLHMERSHCYNPFVYLRDDNDVQKLVTNLFKATTPKGSQSQDPFWDHAAANYLASIVAAVKETFPTEEQTFDNVIEVFEECGSSDNGFKEFFTSLEQLYPYSYAVKAYRRASATQGAERMHASIMGIISEKLMCFGFEEVVAMFRKPKKVDFASMGHKKVALFVSVSDTNFALTPLTSLFVSQAIQGLEREANACPGGMLPTPVRLFLDDFSNLKVPDFDKIISVTRSREIWCTLLCQSVAQLQGLYGYAGAETVIGNCDTQLVLAFQDNATTDAYARRAGKTPDTLLATPQDQCWLFLRGQRPRKVRKFDLTSHERYMEEYGLPDDSSGKDKPLTR